MGIVKRFSISIVATSFILLATAAQAFAVSLTFDKQIGKPGLGGSGELLTPQGIGVQDSTGLIFVSNGRAANPDGSLNTNVGSRVEVFDPKGNYLRSITRPRTGRGEGLDGTADLKFHPKTGELHVGDVFNSEVDVYNPNTGAYIRSYGTFTGQVPNRPFFGPGGMSFDRNGDVYITDFSGDVAKKYDGKTGELIKTFGSAGTGLGQFSGPAGLSVSPNTGRIYITDQYNGRVQVFDSDAKPLFAFGSTGNAPGQFKEAIGIEVDEHENIYVADSQNSRVQVFDQNGKFITSYGKPARDASGNIVPPPTRGGPPFGNPLDLTPGTFNWTGGAHYDRGKLYVGDFFQGRVQVLNVQGKKKVPERASIFGLGLVAFGLTRVKFRKNKRICP